MLFGNSHIFRLYLLRLLPIRGFRPVVKGKLKAMAGEFFTKRIDIGLNTRVKYICDNNAPYQTKTNHYWKIMTSYYPVLLLK
jgi:hypothetical protein